MWCGIEDRVRALSTAQGGSVSLGQAMSLGFTRDEVRGYRESGLWAPVHLGVYAPGNDALTKRGIAIAALLSMPDRISIDDHETRRFTRVAVKHDELRVLTTIAYRLGARANAA